MREAKETQSFTSLSHSGYDLFLLLFGLRILLPLNFSLPVFKGLDSLSDILSSLMRDDFATFIEHDQGWKILDGELRFESLDSLLLGERHGVPWHLFEVPLEVVLLSVGADENDLDGAAVFVGYIVKFFLKVLREQSTWWSPVRAEIEANKLGGGNVGIESAEVNLIDFAVLGFFLIIACDFQEGVSDEIMECLVVSLHLLLIYNF